MSSPAVRVWRPHWPCPVGLNLAPLRHGGGDPTYRVDSAGTHWRGIRTPVGPATLATSADAAAGTVTGRAWGEGADWALHRMPAMLGAEDDPSGFVPRHQLVADAWRRRPHWRIGATGLVMESLVPAVIEQKVTGQEAFAAYRRLVCRFGERAPGPAADLRLWVQPAPGELRLIPSWEWLRLPVDGGRSRPLLGAARVATALERAGSLGAEMLDRRLRTLPGIGVWTSAEVRSRAIGDPDAVSFGDYHIAKNTTWALTGVEGDDDALVELLEPYRGHRHRVQRLVELAGAHRPRRGPRLAPRRHLPA
ncbi:MAG: DNA-3-methyladenine glycosylase 2 family protein [Actinomycetota bacterium]|nr:DNA-3-methyladenine glycosylase 2 family protein [Actinomycetota bacterium]